MTLGCEEHHGYISRRGGEQILYELEMASDSVTHVLDNSGQANVSIPATAASGSSCCEQLEDIEPWRDELLIYRGDDMAHVGPVIEIEISNDGGQLRSQDLFYWTEVRFVEDDLHYFDDASEAFRDLFHYLMSRDDSPNVEVVIHATGVQVLRTYRGQDFHRGGDLLRELARTGLDFTMVGRTLYVGGPEVFASNSTPGETLLLHDEGVTKATVTKDGSLFATDIAVFCGSGGEGRFTRSQPLVGRATREVATHGLVQRTFTELLIKDLGSAHTNAENRLDASQPAPVRLQADLSPEADMEFMELIPGRRTDVRLAEAAGCIKLVDVMRLNQVDIQSGGGGETISGSWIPLGASLTSESA